MKQSPNPKNSLKESSVEDRNGPKFSDNKIVPKLLSVDQLALMLVVPKKTIYGWVYRGILEPIRVGPRLIRFDSEYIARWILKK